MCGLRAVIAGDRVADRVFRHLDHLVDVGCGHRRHHQLGGYGTRRPIPGGVNRTSHAHDVWMSPVMNTTLEIFLSRMVRSSRARSAV